MFLSVLWALATLAVYAGLAFALLIRFRAFDVDHRELPNLLRDTRRFGLGGMALVLVGVGFALADYVWWNGGFDWRSLTSISEWFQGVAVQVALAGPFAAITIVPTVWCWFWERRLRWREE